MGQNDLISQQDLTDPKREARLEAAARRLVRRRTLTETHDADEAAVAETWDALDMLRNDPAILAELRRPYRAPVWQRLATARTLATAAAVVVVIAGGAVAWRTMPQTYSTRVGEQRLIQLADGSQVTLNTDSLIKVRVDGRQRHVELARGEAYFDVAKLGGAPFVVESGKSEVRVTGTRFNVRDGRDWVRVDVEEGRVLAGAHASTQPAGAAVLLASQAVTLDGNGLVRWRGAADIDRVDNWRRGRVYFNETPLRDAVADMNRYSKTHLVITTPGIADMPVSGVFRAGASDSFARALSLAYPLRAQAHDNVIEISQNGHDSL